MKGLTSKMLDVSTPLPVPGSWRERANSDVRGLLGEWVSDYSLFCRLRLGPSLTVDDSPRDEETSVSDTPATTKAIPPCVLPAPKVAVLTRVNPDSSELVIVARSLKRKKGSNTADNL